MTDTNNTTQSATTTPKPLLRNFFMWIILAGIACVIALVAFLPSIASLPMFRGFITDAVAQQVNGRVSIGDMSLTWFGPQQVDNFSIVGNDAKSSLMVSASLRNGLFDLATGSVDQIDVTMSANITGALDADGNMSLLDLAKSSAPAPSAPQTKSISPSAPASSAAFQFPSRPIQVTISRFDATIANASGPAFVIDGLKAKLAVSQKGPLEIQLSANTKIGDKPGTISANGTFTNLFNAAGTFDPIAITGSLNAEVDGVLLPLLDSSAEITQAKFSIDAASAKPIDLQANVAISVNGRPATIAATLQAVRPNSKDPIATWAKDPRTWVGSVQAQNIPTSLFEKFTKGTPINMARDVGSTISLQAATNSATGFDLSLTSTQIQLQSSAAIDISTGAVQGKTTQLNVQLSPELLKPFNVNTPQPLPVTIALQSFYIPPVRDNGQFNLVDLTAQGSLNIGAAQFLQDGIAPVAMGPLNVTLAAAPLADKVDFALATTLNGTQANVTANITGLMRDKQFAFKQMKITGNTQFGPFDPTLLPAMPANIVDILRHVQPGVSTINSTLAGSFESGTLNISAQTIPGVINLKAEWDTSTASLTLANTTLTLDPALVDWASQGAAKISAPAKCTFSAGPIKMDRTALEKGLAEIGPSPVSLFVDQISLAKVPGLTGTAVLQKAVIRGNVDVDGPQLFDGNVSTAAALVNGLPANAGNAAISDMSIQATVERDLNSPKSKFAATFTSLSLTHFNGLSEIIVVKNMRSAFNGPLSFNGTVSATLSADLLDASGPAAKVAGEFQMQSADKWNASINANEVAVQRIARFAGMGDVPEWTTNGAMNAGKFKANVGAQSGAMTFALDADLGRVKANINGSRAANGSIALTKSTANVSVPGDAVRIFLDRGPQKSPLRNLTDINVALDIASITIPSVNGELKPLALGAAIASNARVEPFQVTFATAILSSSTKKQTAPPRNQQAPPEKVATLNFAATDISLQTNGAESAQLNLNGALAAVGQPAKPMSVKVKAQHLTGADGKLNMSTMKLVAGINISEFPSSLIDAISEGDGFIQNLAGPVFSIQLAGQTGFEASDRFKGHIESPTLTLDIPAVRVVDSQIIVVPSEAITFQLRPDENMREHILRPINPILGDIEFKNKAVNTTVTLVRAPLPFDMAKTDARFTVDVGEVELEKSGQLISIMNLATVKDNKSTIPGLLSPLNGEINKGILTYKDFTIHVGKVGNSWQQTIFSEADINLASHPPFANFIRVRYPLEGVTNAMAGNGLLGKSFGNINQILGNTTAQIRQSVQVKVTFSGPLEGDELQMKVEPNLDLPKGEDLLKGLGSIAEGIFGGKSGTTTTTPPAGSPPPQTQPKDVVGGLLDKFLKKPNN